MVLEPFGAIGVEIVTGIAASLLLAPMLRRAGLALLVSGCRTAGRARGAMRLRRPRSAGWVIGSADELEAAREALLTDPGSLTYTIPLEYGDVVTVSRRALRRAIRVAERPGRFDGIALSL